MANKEMFYMNVNNSKEETVVAICDSDLMGGIFKEGRLKLEITEKFYGNTLVKLNDCLEILKNCGNANLVGKKIITAAVKMGLIHEDGILYVDNIPHALIITF